MSKIQMSERASCPLCSMAATREALQDGDGFTYCCAACGGSFQFGTNAQRRAERGKLHPDVAPAVRVVLAEGKLPRVEFTAGEFSVCVVHK